MTATSNGSSIDEQLAVALTDAIQCGIARASKIRSSRLLDHTGSSGYLDDMSDATKLATELSSKDPAVGLRAIASLRALLHSLERLHVENARKSGWSWQQIAAELGVSKQAVHEKHGTGPRLLRSKGR